MQRNFSEKHIIIILCLIIPLYVYITSIDNVGIIILSIPILLILLDIFVFKSPKIQTPEKKDINSEENEVETEKEYINSEENIYISEEENIEKEDINNYNTKSIFQSKALLSLLKIIGLIVIALLCFMFLKSSNSVTF